MRKILLISFIGLALAGCGEKDIKITDDYLIGKWDCQSKYSSAEWRNGEFSDYGEVKQENNIFEFKLDNKILYLKSDKDDKSLEFIIPNPSEPNYSNSDNYYKGKGFKKFENISPNKFTLKIELESRGNNSEDEEIYNFKTKSEDICTRIK